MNMISQLKERLSSLDYYVEELEMSKETPNVDDYIKGYYDGQIFSMRLQKGFIEELLRSQGEE